MQTFAVYNSEMHFRLKLFNFHERMYKPGQDLDKDENICMM